MIIAPEYTPLVIGSKIGVGVQGGEERHRLDAAADRILVLEGDVDQYVPQFGPRCWVRAMHDSTSWRAVESYADHVADVVARCYGHGVRDYLFLNEVIALEGLGAEPDDYRTLNETGVQLVVAIRNRLAARGLFAVRLWGPALSPGHQEDDGFEGYRLLVEFLRLLDGIAGHYYWRRDGGFLTDGDAGSWAGRLLQAHRLVDGVLGVHKPWAVTEFNRIVDLADPNDVAGYAWQCQRYYRWLNSLPWCVAGFTFLFNTTDDRFRQMAWSRMSRGGEPDMISLMSGGWDRQAEEPWEEETPVPPDNLVATFGEGFARVLVQYRDLIGEPTDTPVQIATAQNTPAGEDPYRFSHVRTANGTLLWRKSDNSLGFWRNGGTFYLFGPDGLRVTA